LALFLIIPIQVDQASSDVPLQSLPVVTEDDIQHCLSLDDGTDGEWERLLCHAPAPLLKMAANVLSQPRDLKKFLGVFTRLDQLALGCGAGLFKVGKPDGFLAFPCVLENLAVFSLSLFRTTTCAHVS
jgi:hypothetical protein